MIKILVLSVFLVHSSICLVSDAPYISQSDRPKIAGHRGLSSLFPENTIESELAAMYQGADFIELDVVVSKDKQLIVSHDVYLTRVTDIENHPEFADRKIKRILDGYIMDDWWIMDFTVEELKTLKIKQVLVKGRLNIFDKLFTFPTMQEMLDTLINFNQQHKGSLNPENRLVGVLFESKDHQFHLDYMNINMGDFVVEFCERNNMATIEQTAVKAPIVLMSFDFDTIKQFSKINNLPRVQLVSKKLPAPLSEIVKYAHIIGPELSTLWDSVNQTSSNFLLDIKSTDLLVYSWTFRDDLDTCLNLFNSNHPYEMYQKAFNVMKLDGIITEFPDAAVSYAQSYVHSNIKRSLEF